MKFALNVLWNWLGVAVSAFTATVLTPILIEKLGVNGYGVWTLSFSLIESLLLFDFGLRSAAVKFVAHYYAQKDEAKLTEVLHTSFLWAACLGTAIFAGIAAFAPFAGTFYKISDQYRSQFPVLLTLISASFGLGMTFNLIRNALDAVQRFDLTNRAGIAGTLLRTAGTFLLLRAGYGLIEIGMLTIGSQIFTYFLNFLDFRKVFPGQSLSFRRASKPMFRQLREYGIHTFFSTLANLGLMQGPPIVLARLRSDSEVGYFSLPARLVQYISEVVTRIAVVTGVNISEMIAMGRMDEVRKMAVYPNRYSLALFFPIAIWLLSHGERFLGVLAKPDVVEQSMRVLPWVTIGTLIGYVGQVNSYFLLLAMARHRGVSRMLSVEAVALVAAMYWLVPSYGIAGAAWANMALMILNRGFISAWLVSKELGLNYLKYLASVYSRPMAIAIPVGALAYALSLVPEPASHAKASRVVAQLAAAGAIAAAYYTLAFFTVLSPEHRDAVKKRVLGRLGWKTV